MTAEITETSETAGKTEKPNRMVRILVACMPKSGSTFLSTVISELPGMRREILVPGFERREQELSAQKIEEAILVTKALRTIRRQKGQTDSDFPLGFVAQHHVRYSQPTAQLIGEHNIRSVVLVRNIFDAIVSIYDHFHSGNRPMSMAYIGDDFYNLDKDVAYEFIAEMVIPWYMNFYVSWKHCNKRKIMIRYEDLLENPEKTVARICKRHADTIFSKDDITAALDRAQGRNTRRNQAIAGRGEEIPERVRDKVRAYTTYYPSIDFTPIGL